MAIQVPVSRNPTVSQNALPGVRQQIDAPDAAFGSLQAAQMVKGGRELMEVGDDMRKQVIKEQEERLALQTMDMANRFERDVTDLFYNPESGYLTRKGGNAFGVTKDAEKAIATLRQKYMSDPNAQVPALQQMLNVKLQDMSNNSFNLAQRHEYSEYGGYKSGVLKSRQAFNIESMALNWNDDDEFNSKLAENARLLVDQKNQEGWDDTTFKLNRLKMASEMILTRSKAALQADESPDNILRVNDWFEAQRNGGRVDMASSFEWDGMMDAALPKAEAGMAMASLTGFSGLDSLPLDQLVVGTAKQESGGKQFNADGSVVMSPKGATGIMQIMPETGPEAARMAGVEWDPQKFVTDKDYNSKLGVAYLNSMKAQFGSNTLALVAYNAGPGITRDLMDGTNKSGKNPNMRKIGDPARGEVTAQQFVAQFPYKETRDYVRNINAIAAGPSDAVSYQAVQQKALELEAKRPGAGKALLTMYDDQIKTQAAMKKASETDFLDSVMPKIQGANGNWTVLSPQEIATATQLGVMDKLSSWGGTTDPAVKMKLDLMSAAELAEVDFTNPDIRLALSQSDFDGFLKQQKTILGGGEGGAAAGDIRDRVLKVGQMSLIAAGIDPSPKDNDPAAAQKLMGFVDATNRRVQAFRDENNGKNPTDEQLKKITDNLLMEGSLAKPRGKDGWFGRKAADAVTRSGRAYEALPGEAFSVEPPSNDIIEAVKVYADKKIGLNNIAQTEPNWIETSTQETANATQINYGLNENGIVRLYTKMREQGLSDDEILFYGRP